SALPRGQQNFDEQHVATRRCPSESGGHTDLILLEHLVRINVRDAEKLVKPICGHTNERIVPFCYAASYLAAYACDLAFELTQPGFVGVLKDDRLERGPPDGDVFGSYAVPFHLLRNYVAARNLGLLFLGVTGQPDHFHSIAQGGMNRVEHVR